MGLPKEPEWTILMFLSKDLSTFVRLSFIILKGSLYIRNQVMQMPQIWKQINWKLLMLWQTNNQQMSVIYFIFAPVIWQIY